MSGDAQVAAADLDEERIALCSPHGRDMANDPDQQTHEPEAQAEAHGSGQRAVQDGERARCAADAECARSAPGEPGR